MYSNSKYTCVDCLRKYGGHCEAGFTGRAGGICQCCGEVPEYMPCTYPSDFGIDFELIKKEEADK